MGLFDEKRIKAFIDAELSYNSNTLGFTAFAPRSMSQFDEKSFVDKLNMLGMSFYMEKTGIALKAFGRLNFSEDKLEKLRGTKVCYLIGIPSDEHFTALCEYLAAKSKVSGIAAVYYKTQFTSYENVLEQISYRREALKGIVADLPDGSRYSVMLTDFCDSKVKLIKVVRKITEQGLAEAKNLVERAPVVVYETDNKQSAAEVCFELTQAGGKAQIVVM